VTIEGEPGQHQEHSQRLNRVTVPFAKGSHAFRDKYMVVAVLEFAVDAALPGRLKRSAWCHARTGPLVTSETGRIPCGGRFLLGLPGRVATIAANVARRPHWTPAAATPAHLLCADGSALVCPASLDLQRPVFSSSLGAKYSGLATLSYLNGPLCEARAH
jgi:hypothetical protein